MPSSAARLTQTHSTRPGDGDFTCPWWVIGALAGMFIALALVTAGANTLALDLSISELMQSFDYQLARIAAWIGDHLGGTTTGLTCLAIGFVTAALMRNARDAWFLGIAAILRLLATFLKALSESPRPSAEQVDPLRIYESTGFPSGHATTATLLMGTLAFMVGRRTDRRATWIALGAMWAIGAFITGFARIWHGAHWFTDTVGGMIVGVVIMLVAANLSATIMQARSIGWRTPRPQTPEP